MLKANLGRAVDLATPVFLIGAIIMVGFLIRRGESVFLVKIPTQPAEFIADTTGAPKELRTQFPSGSSNQVFVFTDFHCPFCEDYWEDLKQISEGGSRSFTVHIVHFPIDRLHPNATLMARTVSCLEEAGYSHAAYSLAFAWPDTIDPSPAVGIRLGIEPDSLGLCMASERSADRVGLHVRLGERLGVRSTPTTIIGDSLFRGRLGRSQIRKLIQ